MAEKKKPSLFQKPPRFVLGAWKQEDIPASDITEVAFWGRSNVGKSSLLNALFGRSDVARTSSTPGRTQQLNFFLAEEKLMIVDLPGYGYAKVPRKQAKQWLQLTKDYLQYRRSLRRVYLLVDSRHSVKDSDMEMMDLLDEAAVSYQIILTKADKLKASEIDKALRNVKEQVGARVALYPEMLVTSATKNDGVEALREELLALVAS